MFNSNCIFDGIFFLPGSIRWWSILNPISQAACHPQYRWHWCWRVWSVKYDKVKICRVQKFTSCLFIIFKKLTFLVRRNSRAVLQLLKKWGRLRIRPRSSCNFEPERTSNSVKRTTPLLRSSIRSWILRAGFRYKN